MQLNQLVKGKTDIWLFALSSFLFLLVLPTQFGLHLWPHYSFVYGLKVDYLSPTFYLSDIAFLIYLIFFVRKYGLSELKDELLKRKKVITLLLFIILLNIIFSLNIPVTAFKWIKVLEWGIAAFMVGKSFGDIHKWVWIPFLSTTVVVFILALGQVINGHTLGGIFYFLGERNFNSLTPGISLVNIFGRTYMRAYSTFSHPNSMAGFELLSLFLFLRWRKKSKLIYVGIVLSFFSVLLSFSKGAYIALALSFLIYLFGERKIARRSYLIIIVFFISSLLIFLLPNATHFSLPFSLQVRSELLGAAQNLFTKNPVLGVGLGAFIGEYSSTVIKGSTTFFLQPVHNIFILVLTEIGIIGFILFFIFLVKLFRRIEKRRDNQFLFIIFFIILFTGFFDHYSLTLQQNFLLTAFLTGMSLQDTIS